MLLEKKDVSMFHDDITNYFSSASSHKPIHYDLSNRFLLKFHGAARQSQILPLVPQ
jgi:hypothetical protein